jgi:hypothetical protein
VDFAPRISRRLRREIERLADRSLTAAEITRGVGTTAEALGLRRPSYQQVRVLVREHRGRPKQPSTADVVLDVALRVRPPISMLDHLAGKSPPVKRK